jgi:hypothetical protein
MKPNRESRNTAAADRRASPRRATPARVRLEVEARALEGQVENVSRTGVLFSTPENLRVVVEIGDGMDVTRRSGKLVRAQVIAPGRTGWAVEFDAE